MCWMKRVLTGARKAALFDHLGLSAGGRMIRPIRELRGATKVAAPAPAREGERPGSNLAVLRPSLLPWVT